MNDMLLPFLHQSVMLLTWKVFINILWSFVAFSTKTRVYTLEGISSTNLFTHFESVKVKHDVKLKPSANKVPSTITPLIKQRPNN